MPAPALSVSSVLSPLSGALDLGDGHAPGHAARTCVIAMWIAKGLGLDDEAASDLFHAALLKDAGGSSNAERVLRLFGGPDEHLAKRAARLWDWRTLQGRVRLGLDSIEPGGTPVARLSRLVQLARAGRPAWRELFAIRGERGAAMVRAMGFSEAAAQATLAIDEHWDGGGQPAGLRGPHIPLAARIIGLAQVVEIFRDVAGPARAMEVAQERRGRWFDPALVDCLTRVATSELWGALAQNDPFPAVAAVEPRARLVEATDARLDQVATAFAWIVDAKSRFTVEHSRRVAEIAHALGERLGLASPELMRLRRAALMHDLGKLTVSNAVLDKAGPLAADEWQTVRQHPYYTLKILQRVPVFARLAEDSANHHERLDGRGYFRGLRGEAVSATSRLLAVADVADALMSARPHRAAMPIERVMKTIEADAGAGLCPDAVAALRDAIEHDAFRLPAAVAV
jgi:HD-GYP domain-containing protein (c-di-GMP phosphodiesterase class II)